MAEEQNDIALLAEGEDTTPTAIPVREPLTEPTGPEEVKAAEPEKTEEPEEEPKPEETKDLPPHERPSIAELKAEFPEIFKKFPTLRDMYFREQEYSQLFTTVAEAKEAAENSSAFESLRDEVLSGNSTQLFTAIKEADEAALVKIAPELLPSLYKISPDLHYQASLPLLQNLVQGFYREGVNSGNDDVTNSALHLSKFLFGDLGVAKGERSVVRATPPEKSAERLELEKEREAFEIEKHKSFFVATKNDADLKLAKEIQDSAGGKSKVDPDGTFSKFIRETIVAKVAQEVGAQMENDQAHMNYMNSLWDKAKKSGYSDEWKSRILSAYLARAKQLIPTIRAKFVSEANGSASVANGKKMSIVDQVASRKDPAGNGRPTGSSEKSLDPRRIDWTKTSDEDLLNDKITYKN